jgi:hypothetical protein
MIFQLQLQNAGKVGYRFELFTYHSDNTGGLKQLINRATLQGPHLYEQIETEETIFTTLTIHRGPELYEYDPLVLGFRLACGEGSHESATDTATTSNRESKIIFEQKCPKLRWAGLDNGFRIDINKDKDDEIDGGGLPLIYFNSDYMISNF